MKPRIQSVLAVGPYTLRLGFSDGSVGTVNLRDQIEGKGGVFAILEHPEFFAKVAVDSEAGTIVWPNGVDLDPDVLHSITHFETKRASA